MHEQTKIRIEFIDIFRGCGIILMIMGHIGFGYKFDYFIHAFHMPMFFFVSGYFFKPKQIEFNKFLKIKVKALLVPYFLFGLFHYVLWIILNIKEMSIKPLMCLFFVNTENGLPIANALWFLTALFCVDVLYFIINKHIKNKLILTIIILNISIFGTLSTKLFNFRLPWALDAACVGIGFYHIARMLKYSKYRVTKKVFQLSLSQCLIIGLITMLSIFNNGYINMRTGNYSNILLFLINSLLAILVGWNLSRIIQEFKFIKSINVVFLCIKYIGRNSITYLCFNQLIILILKKIFLYLDFYPIIENIIMLIMVLVILYFCDYFIRNIFKIINFRIITKNNSFNYKYL